MAWAVPSFLYPLQKAEIAITTRCQLVQRARRAIERDEAFIYDVAAHDGQIAGNMRHTRWFVRAVADRLIDNTGRWSHLEPL